MEEWWMMESGNLRFIGVLILEIRKLCKDYSSYPSFCTRRPLGIVEITGSLGKPVLRINVSMNHNAENYDYEQDLSLY